MVKTPRRPPPPAFLLKKRKIWEARFERVRAGACKGDWATRDCKRILAAALRELAHGKCVYCESALGVTSDTEVEHYIAKTVDCSLAFEWSNLLPACHLCNRAKAGRDHRGALLKPDDEDPEPYFWLHPDTGELQPHPKLSADQRQRALETIQLCNLQRAALCTQRVEMMGRVARLLQHPTREEWDALSHPASQYKFVLRHVLTLQGLLELAAEDRRLFEQ